jgi:uncharacterized membrane protein
MNMSEIPILPAHIEETIQAIAKLQADHRSNATPFQRTVERLTTVVARSAFVGSLTVVILLWIGGNILAGWLHLQVLDAPPFYWLQGAAGVLALYITVIILATQRRENELADLREQLNLELVIINEQKTAKVIQLLEQLRFDIPQVEDRHDPEATAMAQPANPEIMLEAIKETQDLGEVATKGEDRSTHSTLASPEPSTDVKAVPRSW